MWWVVWGCIVFGFCLVGVVEVLEHFGGFPAWELWVVLVEAVDFVGDVVVDGGGGDLLDVSDGAGGEVGLADGFVVAVEAADEGFVGVAVDDEESGVF